MNEFLKSGRGFAFSLEVTLSLIACLAFVSMLSFHAQEDLSEAMVYKQASDFLEIAAKDGSLEDRNATHLNALLHELGLKAKLSIEGDVVLDEQPKKPVRIERLLVTKELSYETVVLEAGA